MPANHPLDDPDDEAINSAASVPRFPVVEPGRTFPLSLLVFLFTLSSLFFAIWRLSPSMAIFSLCVISPGLIRTMWLVEQRRMNGESVSFREQAWMWLSSTAVIAGTLGVFLVSFLVVFGSIVWLSYVTGALLLGPNGDYDGLVLGVALAMPVASGASILAAAGLLKLTWGADLNHSVDIRN